MDGRAKNDRSAEQGIDRVLAAEREALAAIATCDERADAVRRDARAEVRRNVRRTQARISRLHTLCAAKTRELVAGIEAEIAADVTANDRERDSLREAVRIIARRLTGQGAADGD